jgi:5-methylcytosine-specific restriction endonuclease McrA
MESLVLNTYSTPVSIVPSLRAISLVVTEKAIALVNYEGTVFRSERLTIPIPSVIQCTHSHYIPKKYVSILPFTRKNVYIRDQGHCMYCGKKVSLSQFTFDHVIPRCQGGKSCWTNVVICCYRCNAQKGRKSLDKFKRPLLRQPYAPKLDKAAPSHLVSRLAGEIPHKTWEDYLYWSVILEP